MSLLIESSTKKLRQKTEMAKNAHNEQNASAPFLGEIENLVRFEWMKKMAERTTFRVPRA